MTPSKAMDKLEEALRQINRMVERAKLKRLEGRKRGEQFNVFRICGLEYRERSHSAFLAEFLNPKGCHGQGDVFLKAFVESVLDHTGLSEFDTQTATVVTEYCTGNGLIDILITNHKQQAIIIENKIYAADQPEQLIRYDEFAQRTFHKGNYTVLYLTLWGDEANPNSAQGVDYQCISYSQTILKWLNKCLQLSVQRPLLRETLIQYTNLIKELTNQAMEELDKDEVLRMMVQNSQVVATICNMQYDFFQYVGEKVITPMLREVAQEMGFEFHASDHIWGGAKYEGFDFCKGNLRIKFQADGKHMTNLYYGFEFINDQPNNVRELRMPNEFKGQNVYWPYGSVFLDQYRYWDTWTLSDIITQPDLFKNYFKSKIVYVLNILEENGVSIDSW